MDNSNKPATASVSDAIALAVTTYFEQNKAKSKVYSTADGFLFENLGFAKNHASTLDDKNVTPHTKSSNEEVVDEDILNNYQLTDVDIKLLDSGLVKENYNALRSLVNRLKIETIDQKAETLINALEEYKLANLAK